MAGARTWCRLLGGEEGAAPGSSNGPGGRGSAGAWRSNGRSEDVRGVFRSAGCPHPARAEIHSRRGAWRSNGRSEGTQLIEDKIDVGSLDLKDEAVSINRVTMVVKGGKNLSFSALVVIGDGAGHVGYGMGKAREVASAIKKGIEAAKKNVFRVPITAKGATIPHTVTGHFGSGLVLLKPASEGTGVIAGGAVRAVTPARDPEHTDEEPRLHHRAHG